MNKNYKLRVRAQVSGCTTEQQRVDSPPIHFRPTAAADYASLKNNQLSPIACTNENGHTLSPWPRWRSRGRLNPDSSRGRHRPPLCPLELTVGGCMAGGILAGAGLNPILPPNQIPRESTGPPPHSRTYRQKHPPRLLFSSPPVRA